MGFRCVAIATADAERFRASGRDDYGRAVIRRVATGQGEPCRHCLRLAAAGEEILLLSYHLPRPLGVYWTPSPIFLHAGACERYAGADALPEIVRENGLISVRAYDGAGMCLYDLGQVCEGVAARGPLEAALADRRTAFVNIHTARPGCLLCSAEALG